MYVKKTKAQQSISASWGFHYFQTNVNAEKSAYKLLLNYFKI